MSMFASTITSKGQVTLPAKLRKEMGVKPTDRIIFSKKNGNFVIERLASIDSLFGSLANPKVRPLTDIQMKRMIEKGMFSDDDTT